MNSHAQLEREIAAGLRRMLDAGSHFADARLYVEATTESLQFNDGNLEGNSASQERGIGTRVLHQGAWGFAASADLNGVHACFDRALANARAAARLPGFRKDMGQAQPLAQAYAAPVAQDPFSVPLGEKLAFLRDLDTALRQAHVEHRYASATFQRRHVLYLNSEGSRGERRQLNTFASIMVMATDRDGRNQRRSCDLRNHGGGTRGWEWLAEPANLAAHTGRVTAELALLLAAETLPPATCAAILLPGQGHLQVHETIGHALELDRILGYELSYAGGSHVRPEMIGSLQYGSAKLTCVAGVTPNSPGTFGFDDEGTPQYEYPLIDRGLLVNVLSSRGDLGEANAKAGKQIVAASGACARACAFYRPPIDRMTNINIVPGTDGTLADIVAATGNGIILDLPVSWSIGSNREHFHFGCEIAWEVKDGCRGRVFKNPTYHGHTLPFWRGLDKVGDERTWELVQVANCGKGEPNQIMEVGHGVPVMRFAEVAVGEGVN